MHFVMLVSDTYRTGVEQHHCLTLKKHFLGGLVCLSLMEVCAPGCSFYKSVSDVAFMDHI